MQFTMRFTAAAVFVLSLLAAETTTAFHSPQHGFAIKPGIGPNHRQLGRLNEKPNGVDIMKRGFKKFLVPNARTPYTPAPLEESSITSPPNVEVVKETVIPPPAPVVIDTVPRAPPPLPDPIATDGSQALKPEFRMPKFELPERLHVDNLEPWQFKKFEPPPRPEFSMPKFDVPERPDIRLPDLSNLKIPFPETPATTSRPIKDLLEEIGKNYDDAVAHLVPNQPQISMMEYFKDRTSSLPTFPTFSENNNPGFQVNHERIAELQENWHELQDSVAATTEMLQATTQQQLETLQNNIDQMDGPLAKLLESLHNFAEMLNTQPAGVWTPQDAVDALGFDQIGGWYLLALSVAAASIAAAGRNEDLEPSKVIYGVPVTDYMEQEAQWATQQAMQQQIVELTEALNTLSTELKTIKTQKAARDYEVATMKSDMRELQNALDSQKLAEKGSQEALAVAELKFTDEVAILRSELEVSSQREETLMQQLAVTETSLIEERKKVERAEKQITLQSSESDGELKSLEAENSSLKAELRSLAQEAADLAVQLGVAAPANADAVKRKAKAPTFFAAVEEMVEDELPTVSSHKATKLTAKKTTKAKTKKAVKQTTKVDAEQASVSVTKQTKAAKIIVEPASVSTTTDDVDDWSKLPPSTLRRKTVKELIDYLQAKGVNTLDSTGKPLKKAELLDTISSVIA